MWYPALSSFKKYHLVQYEKIRNNPFNEFEKLIEFLEKDVNAQALKRAIEETDFQKMKAEERKGLHGNFELSHSKSNDEESFKVRKGKVGGYIDYLTDSEIAYANGAMDKLHPDLKKLFVLNN
jgi:hypothetical protein